MIAVGTLLVAVVVLGGYALLRGDPWGDTGNRLSERFSLDGQDYQHADPALIAYAEIDAFPVDMDQPQAVAAGPDGAIFVAGDRRVVRFSPKGQIAYELTLEEEPTCVTVAGPLFAAPGSVFVGAGGRVLVFAADGRKTATWNEGFDPQSVLTSIAVAEQDVFVADAGKRLVWHFDPHGQLIGRIGELDAERGIRGFVIPSPYFDVAVTPDGLLRVTNPGARRIETFTFQGDLLGHWGTASAAIEGFFGCCNPSNLAVLPDGRFVTAEKGIPRIKIYTAQGEFASVVADPETLGQRVTQRQLQEDSNDTPVFDVAVSDQGNIVVLDPVNRQVRLFAENQP
jgi:sugar lactone lactonase YvrE